jgi:putative peptidoglycan lipid II flippase
VTGVLRSILSISAATVLSRVTGYVRLSAQAAVLGVGVVADAYALAVLLPSLIYELFLGGILYSIFIPVLVDRITGHGEEDARRPDECPVHPGAAADALLALLGVVFAGPLVALVVGLSPSDDISPADARETTDLAVFFFRIFAVQMLFYGVTTIATGVLQAHRRFFLPTFAPVLNNLIIVASFGAYFFLKGEDGETAVYVLAFG